MHQQMHMMPVQQTQIQMVPRQRVVQEMVPMQPPGLGQGAAAGGGGGGEGGGWRSASAWRGVERTGSVGGDGERVTKASSKGAYSGPRVR